MRIESIVMDRLVDHPDNSNVMSDEAMEKLQRHIERTGCYEPLVVRRHPELTGHYQIINGHHRRAVLKQLDYTQADCVAWEVSDDETLMLLATLNRLRGQDDVPRRARLVKMLSERYAGQPSVESHLPETKKQLVKLLELARPPRPVDPESLGEMPEAMTFFVSGRQKQLIERALRQVSSGVGGDCAGDDQETGESRRLSRGDLLACMANLVLRRQEKNIDGYSETGEGGTGDLQGTSKRGGDLQEVQTEAQTAASLAGLGRVPG